MTQVVEVEIPDFGTSVLGSLNQQRLCGQYCDVSILVQGQAFEAHRAVLAASSLYFRDLFSSAASSSSLSVFELPSSVTPACFRQILTFCYTGRLSMTPSQQLLLMYTAGYLQIQSVVERGMELMMKSSSSPLCCDSQTPSAGDDVQQQQHHRGLTPEELLLVCSRIKQERPETPVEDREERGAAGGLPATRGSALCYMGPGGTAGASSADVVPSGLQSYLQATGERSSPGGSSLPATDSPTSHPTEEELEEDFYSSSTHGVYGQIYGHASNPYLQEKMELLSLPLASERRPCVLIGRDTMALPASLISQIGYRCHPTLYSEGDPGEKVELVGGSGVYMTRGQLMNCHLCAGIKHKVLLRRLLATFFDRNTLANSCGTGIRSSTNDPSRKPLDNRVLNTVKLYCQNFAPNFKESEMNVIAADMCTNARRVRKRWLPKIQSLLPEGHPTPHPAPHQRKNKKRDPQSQQSSNSPFDLELRHLSTTYLRLDPHQEHSDKEGERGKEAEREKERRREGEREKERGREGERGRGVLHFGSSSGTDGEKEVVQPEDSIPSSHRSSLPSSLSSLSPQEKEGPGDPSPSGSGLAETEEMGEELQEESQ